MRTEGTRKIGFGKCTGVVGELRSHDSPPRRANRGANPGHAQHAAQQDNGVRMAETSARLSGRILAKLGAETPTAGVA
jgi:hypothetical protein